MGFRFEKSSRIADTLSRLTRFIWLQNRIIEINKKIEIEKTTIKIRELTNG